MKAGPKAAVDASPLPWRSRRRGRPGSGDSARSTSGCRRARRCEYPAAAADWQRTSSGLSSTPTPSRGPPVGCCPAGRVRPRYWPHLGLYELFPGGEGAMVCVVAIDERQAGSCFNIARRMVELDDELASRCRCSRRGWSSRCVTPSSRLPARGAEAAGGLGLHVADPVDEFGVVSRDSYERVLTLAQGKREARRWWHRDAEADPVGSGAADLRASAIDHPRRPSMVRREFTAAGFEEHPVDCQHCWEVGNPALDDFLHRDAMNALLPPKTRGANTFRRARLCQLAA